MTNLIFRSRTAAPNIVDFWIEVEDDRVELFAERGDICHKVLSIEEGVITVTTAPDEVFERLGLRRGLKGDSGFHMPLIEDDELSGTLTWEEVH